MSFIICSMPGCQTSAGCQCFKPKPSGWPAGKKMIAGAKEALAVAKGEQPAASITLNGHTYYPASEITRLQAELSSLKASAKEARAEALEEALSKLDSLSAEDLPDEFVGKSASFADVIDLAMSAIREMKVKS